MKYLLFLCVLSTLSACKTNLELAKEYCGHVPKYYKNSLDGETIICD